MSLIAVVLAGGLGTRIASVTGDRLPKALVEVAGRPFLDRKLDELARGGVEEVVLLVGHNGDAVVEHVSSHPRNDLRVRCVLDGERLLGTGGAVRAALHLLPEAFWVTYGDTLLEASMPELERRWRASGLAGLMTVVENADREQTSNTSVVDGVVSAYAKGDLPGTHRYLDYGLLVLPRGPFSIRERGEAFDVGEVVRDLAGAGQLAAVTVDGWFHDIGTPEALRRTMEWCAVRDGRGGAA